MPFVKSTEESYLGRPNIKGPTFADPDPSWGEISRAMFRTENTVGSMISSAYYDLPDRDVGDVNYDVWDQLSENERLDDRFLDLAITLNNNEELAEARRYWSDRTADRETIARGGMKSFAMALPISGFFDPINLIPIGGMAVKAYKSGNILKGAMASLMTAGATTSAQEAILHVNQAERTMGESAMNVSAAMFLGGVLGAGFAKLSKRGLITEEFLKDIEDSLDLGTPLKYSEEILDAMGPEVKYAIQSQQKATLLGKSFAEDEIIRLKEILKTQKLSKKELAVLDKEARNLRKKKKQLIKPLATLEKAERRASSQELSTIEKRLGEINRLKKASHEGAEAGRLLSNDARVKARLAEMDSRSIDLPPAKLGVSQFDELGGGLNQQPVFGEVLEPLDLGPSKVDIGEVKVDATDVPKGGDAGSAKVKDDVRVKGKIARAMVKYLGFSPLTRALTSVSDATRKIANSLAENPILMEGAKVAQQAVESIIRTSHGIKTYPAMKAWHDNFLALKKSGSKMTKQEFSEAVTKEMRNPSPTANKYIKDTAQSFKKHVYDPIKDELLNEKMLPEDIDVKTAVNYVNRVYNKEKIRANYPLFIQRVATWLKSEDARYLRMAEQARQEIKSFGAKSELDGKELKYVKELEKRIKRVEDRQSMDLEDVDYDEMAREIGTKITGTPDGRLPYSWKIGDGGGGVPGINVRGALKARSFAISDELVEDFLENDITVLSERYSMQLVADLELQKRFGSVDMKNQIYSIEREWDALIKRAETPEERIKLGKRKDADVRDIAAMRDRIRHTYMPESDPNSMWARVFRTARNLNYLRFMGGVVPASIPDVARIFMAEGFYNSFGKGVVPLIRNLKKFKVSAEEMKGFGIGVDVLKSGGGTRGEIMYDISDIAAGGSKFERLAHSGAQKFNKWNLMNHWTAAVKQLHAVVMQNRVFNALSGSATARETRQVFEKLARLGISEDNAKLMMEQVKKHGGKTDGSWHSNWKSWDIDKSELSKMWGAALQKESDRVIVVPGQDKSLFASSEMGKSLLQFRSFMFAATQRVTIAGIQRQDKSPILGLAGLTTLGMMTYWFKQVNAGRELSDDPKAWIMEGIDRSGSLGMIMEINNTIEKMSDSNMGLRALTGVSTPASRFASRTRAEGLLGATAGSLFSTVLDVGAGLTSDEGWTNTSTRAMRRLAPTQNLFYLRKGFDEIEKLANKAIK